ncbi:hypothetical protein GWI33_002427 [Rhynchophorus ferrugineus]|uniref:Uncharacterized protein n=1 Tax=Rhynchophorus ferrugineus TaxID=354439 RepID=A0A834IV72_RHYFE|nr:hypothetical protein GWI33_002427 [Rhynchophorus ferrugineus]
MIKSIATACRQKTENISRCNKSGVSFVRPPSVPILSNVYWSRSERSKNFNRRSSYRHRPHGIKAAAKRRCRQKKPENAESHRKASPDKPHIRMYEFSTSS